MGNKQQKAQGKPAVKPTDARATAEKKNVYRLHISTDKPIYKPGETIRFVGYAMDKITKALIQEEFAYSAIIEGPGGDVIVEREMISEINGVTFGSWDVPADQSGGDYIVKIRVLDSEGSIPAQRKFNIRSFRPPRLNTQIEFAQRGYGPGDHVVASLKVTRAEGGVPEGAKCHASARLDGKEVYSGDYTVPASGVVSIQYDLPKEITTGDGSLSVVIDDGSGLETASKTMPILLSVDVEFFPEGGHLVYGAPGRVYMEAFTLYGEPADITAEVVDVKSDAVVATIATAHEGRGVSSMFTVEKGVKYRVRVIKPSGLHDIPISDDFAVGSGVSLIALDAATASDSDVKVLVTAPAGHTGKYAVELFHEDVVVATQDVSFADDCGTSQTVALKPSTDNAYGVLRVLVREDTTPICERLVFRRPLHFLNVVVSTTKTSNAYTPSEEVTVNVTVTDEKGNPVEGALLTANVVDESVREMLETRKLPPRLPEMAYLEDHVNRIEDAPAYLGQDDDSARAVDLLLGTQGWRRFATMNVEQFLKEHGDAGRRALGLPLELKESVVRRPMAPPEPQMMFMMAPPAMMFFGGAPPAPPGGWEEDGCVAECAPPMPVDAMDNAFLVADDQAPPQPIPVPDMEKFAVQDATEIQQQQPVVVDLVVNEKMMEEAPPQMEREFKADLDMLGDRDMRIMGGDQKRRVLKKKILRRDDRDEIQDWQPPKPAPGVYGGSEQLLYVREYKHTRDRNWKLGERKDFATSVYWNAGIETDKAGKASFTFHLSDSVTSFHVMIDAVSKNGAGVGAGDLMLNCALPFYVESKMPLAVTLGDKVEVSVGVANSTSEDLNVKLTSSASAPLALQEGYEASNSETVSAQSRARRYVPLHVTEAKGSASLSVAAEATTRQGSLLRDNITRTTNVDPFGFPIRKSFGGQIEADSKVTHKVHIDEKVFLSSVVTEATVFATPSGQLLDSLKALIRDPSGCFEQTSMTLYPLVMAVQYFNANGGAPPEVLSEINSKLEAGYKRLLSYECKENGFEWFGASPAHEALTAYGFMEFTDLAKVFPVDAAMLKRTLAYVLKRRNGKGGFERSAQALDDFGGAPEDITNAYITWALTYAEEVPDISEEIKQLKTLAETSTDNYFIGLVANVLVNMKQDEPFVHALLERIAQSQNEAGAIVRSATSITRSGGSGLLVETSSLFVLAVINSKSDTFRDVTDKVMKFIYSQWSGSSFGNTQSTIMGLKALVAYEVACSTPKAEGSVLLYIDGKKCGNNDPYFGNNGFDENTQGVMNFSSFSDLLTTGDHTIEIEMLGGSRMQYSIDINYTSPQPDNSEKCTVSFTNRINSTSLKEGQLTEVVATIQNKTAKSLPMTVAIIGLPGGLEARVDKLQELQQSGKIAFYELKGSREVVLYWRYLAPNAQIEISFDVIAAVSGKFSAPPSRAYLYYTAEDKVWADPLNVEVTHS